MNISQSQLIYFCLPTRKAYLYPFKTRSFKFDSSKIQHGNSRQAKIQSLKYRNNIGYLGRQYEQLFIVCIPTYDIQLHAKLTENQQIQGFIKVLEQTEYPCYLSGKRSAICFLQNRVMRLKGCGNMLSGFEFVKGSGLRGSHFYHTSKRQMLMTHQINQILVKHGKRGGNIPIGFFEYQQNVISKIPSNLKDELPLLSKYCCVFETLGQRRLGTHLLSALQILLTKYNSFTQQNLKQLFKDHNRYAGTFEATPVEWDFEQIKQNELFLDVLRKKVNEQKQKLNLITIDKLEKYITENYSYSNPEQTINQINKIYGISQKYAIILKQKLLRLLSTPQFFRNIFYLFSKLGEQIGDIKRIFCQNSINWGFFEDHGVTHCNAHLNNFIIIKPSSQNLDILAPLDFDLAFIKSEYLDIEKTSPIYGNQNPKHFQTLFQGEYRALQLSISGQEVMNFKYSIQSEVKSEHHNMIKTLSRDVLMKGFLNGMNKRHEDHKFYRENLQFYQELIDAALIISMQFET